MPGSYTILPERGLVYVRYEGFITLDEANTMFADYTRNPDSHPGQKQLVDLSRVTDWERDFFRLMKMQAEKAEVFLDPKNPQFMMILYAPTARTQEVGRHFVASWQGVRGIVVSLQHDEAGALAILGQPESSFDALLASVA
ncbi:hypothetical protein [Maritimibacter sp. DP1N21-5]|uniref:hypothetical protein n=1 Tax=Maritimibacter sp. DP1N21-5 TaxID=2836867 RepID=UPI001C43D4E9|nr:hypothetical protein [Maritimibacter sp. DP1N21-5]MBV7410003.1 hypothetical protein [Maritimibacter sp. DP1N21-5]